MRAPFVLGDDALGVGGWWRCVFPLLLCGFAFYVCRLSVGVMVCGAPLGVVAGVRTHFMEGTEVTGVSMSTYT